MRILDTKQAIRMELDECAKELREAERAVMYYEERIRLFEYKLSLLKKDEYIQI